MAEETARLIVVLEGAPWTSVPLAETSLTIGRAPENGLTLPHPSVSRRHAEVRREAAEYTLVDLRSANGTTLNGVPLLADQPYRLEAGAEIVIGPFTLTYQPTGQTQRAADSVAVKETPETPRPAEPARPVREPDPPRLVSEAVAPPLPPRPTLPAPLPPAATSSYLEHLPIFFQDNLFLARFLLLFEAVWEPIEQRQDFLPMYFDPRTTPVSFLPWFVSWVGFTYQGHWPESRVRSRLAETMELYRWRGTSYGLTRMLEIVTGVTPRITQDPSTPLIFRVEVAVSAGSDVDLDLVEAMIVAHKPAHAGYILDVRR